MPDFVAAVMIVLPGAFGVITPSAEMVAAASLLEVHVIESETAAMDQVPHI